MSTHAVSRAQSNSNPEAVQTTGGLVSGALNAEGDVCIFKGIPYAAPPVGNLRWREPQPVVPWQGVRKCTEFGPSAMQSPRPDQPNCSEDCLYLNVWAPANTAVGKRPVIVVIHGGGFVSGSGSIPIFDGEATAKKGAIVVTVNYRLGIFGFLAHPALSAESSHHVSGNYSILDLMAAFQWVKQNIAAFGGDPANITADGGSSGSCSIHVMVGSPLAKGLFQRVISESGPLFKQNITPGLKDAEADGLATMERLHAHTLAEMRALPAEALLNENSRREPVIDGYVLPDALIHIFEQGKQNKVDLLIGYNEGDNGLEEQPLSAASFTEKARQKYGEKAGAFLQIYPAHNDDEAMWSQQHQARDLIFARESYAWAKYQQAKGGRVWFYYYSHPAPGHPAAGAFHGAQTPYALHNLDKWDRPAQPWDLALSDTMHDYWINFAATGNPNGSGMPAWPAFQPTDTRVIQFGEQVTAAPLPALPAFAFFNMDPEVSLDNIK